jgi:hypothetical protein
MPVHAGQLFRLYFSGVHRISLLIHLTTIVYVATRYEIAVRRDGSRSKLATVGLVLLTIPPVLFYTVRFFAALRRFVFIRQGMSGLINVYYAVLAIMLLAHVGAEVLVVLEAEAEDGRREACRATNRALDQLLVRLRDEGTTAALVEQVAASLAYEDCDFNNWGPTSNMPVFFCFTVITTIGYGTTAPATQGGRLFTGFYAVTSIGLVVFAITQIAIHMSSALSTLIAFLMPTELALNIAFKAYDKDGSGKLSKEELMALFDALKNEEGIEIDEAQYMQLVMLTDPTGKDEVDIAEFKRAITRVGLSINRFSIHYYKTGVILAINMALVLGVTLRPHPTSSGDVWSRVDNFYYCVITLSTVGLGDLTWATESPVLLGSFLTFAMCGLGLFGTFVGVISEMVVSLAARVNERWAKMDAILGTKSPKLHELSRTRTVSFGHPTGPEVPEPQASASEPDASAAASGPAARTVVVAPTLV